MIIQIVKFKSALSYDKVQKVAKERRAQFQSIPGLLQKYYARVGQPSQYAGIYLWDSMESLNSYLESDLAASIPEAYKVLGPPDVEVFNTVFQLRE
jgi:heme-degrading monooxygenase HmoA